MKPHTVTIFTKPGCGLCEEAEEVIESVRARQPFELVRRNILENHEDYERYKHDIPVILVDGVEVARHRLSEVQLEGALRASPIIIIIMAKLPRPGQVKTRLLPALTPDDAAQVHEAFLRHVVTRLRGRRRVVCYDPPSEEIAMRELLGGVELYPQVSGDLGARLAAAARTVGGAGPLIFLGVDSPDVPLAFIDHVAELLASHDVVIAPADDGGYWAVALSQRVDAGKLFAGIEWSTGREGAQTLERARELGYNVALADQWTDVDRPADLSRLIERLRRSAEPDDRKLLARLAEFLPDAE
jgi:hypothetical protein